MLPATHALIVEHEGLGQPWQWPGGDSGVTLGYGYDLGHHTPAEVRAAWAAHLPAAVLEALIACCGAQGPRARGLARGFGRVPVVTQAAAAQVLAQHTWPKYARQAQQAFGPGLALLPAQAREALVSVVMNRGPALESRPGDPFDRRRELRAIRGVLDALHAGRATGAEALTEIAAQVRSMKRLWAGAGLAGLIRRREDEARLIESCSPTAAGG